MEKNLLAMQILADIFENHESPEKVHIRIYPDTKDVKIVIDDLDEEWFNELKETGCTQVLIGRLTPSDIFIEGEGQNAMWASKEQADPIGDLLCECDRDNNAFAGDANPQAN